jgi:hypothetical protein
VHDLTRTLPKRRGVRSLVTAVAASFAAHAIAFAAWLVWPSHDRQPSVPPPVELPIEEVDVPADPPAGVAHGDGTRSGLGGPAPDRAPHGAKPAAHEHEVSLVGPAPDAGTVSEEDRLRKLREEVAVAMLAPSDGGPNAGEAGARGEPGLGSPDGVKGGQGPARPSFQYLTGWLRSRVSARNVTVAPSERAAATVVASVTMADGVVTRATITRRGSDDAYNAAIEAALAALVGSSAPASDDGVLPTGSFAARVPPR